MKWTAVSLAFLLVLVCACTSTRPPPGREGTLVVMLGAGTPDAEPDRSGPAVAVVAGGRPYLVDCGPGVVRQVTAAQRAGVGLGQLAVRARPKLLVLTHQLLWGASEDAVLAEVRQHFDGEVVFANDLEVY